MWETAVLVLLLVIMEVSLSFDNAVVNAAVLRNMSSLWQKRFLTWGILIAVFATRLVLPVLIVALSTGLGMWQIATLALSNPGEYALHVTSSSVLIASFGGVFLLMVFLSFVIDAEKDTHWLKWLEHPLSYLGNVKGAVVLITLLTILGFWEYTDNYQVALAGAIGFWVFVIMNAFKSAFAARGVVQAGFAAFMYLEVLDASFSLDGVVAAFAMSNNIWIIMTGLGVGALCIRSMTVYLVRKGTLDELVYLEHGAMWGIGALAVLMLVSTFTPVSHLLTGLVGVGFIILSVISSLKYRRVQHG